MRANFTEVRTTVSDKHYLGPAGRQGNLLRPARPTRDSGTLRGRTPAARFPHIPGPSRNHAAEPRSSGY